MSVEFVRSAADARQFPRDGLPEIAFVGRSNVGKSSLLNTLLRSSSLKRGRSPAPRKQLARVSRTPGRTQQLNFYLVDQAFYFVDLPGYGFAKVPKGEMDRWKRLAESFLAAREPLRLTVVIVDARHGAKEMDRQMVEWLRVRRQPFTIVASKIDKLKPSERMKALQTINEHFHAALPFSAKTGEGAAALWSMIREALAD